MQLRSLSLSAAAFTLSVLVACGPARGPTDAGVGGGSGGGTGGGSATGGGSGGGTGGGTGGSGGAGGGTSFTCAQSCAGCCDAAGVCQTGSAATTCGRGGAACASCSSPATCVSGICKDTTCATCTLSGTCQTSLSNTVCGNGGIACLDCAASGAATCNLDAGACTGGTCAGCRGIGGACVTGNTKGACGTGGGTCASCTGTNVCSNGTCVSGPTPDGGGNFSYDGGTTISAIKGALFCSDKVTLKNVVITAIANQFLGGQGDYQAQFWVAEPGNLKQAIYVDKFFSDPTVPAKVALKVGDLVDIEGYTFRQGQFTDRIAYRLTLKSQFSCRKPDGTFYSPAAPVTITVVDGGTVPAAPMAPAGFGDAMMGTARPNPDFASARVFVPGPLKITNPSPMALKRLSASTTDNTYFGFEVTGGILVNNFNTFDRNEGDGGTLVRCDYRKKVLDGGSVVFPNGITAVYDTYSHAPCEDGGTGCAATDRRLKAVVPGTTNDYTYVLYPADCTELVGVYDAGN